MSKHKHYEMIVAKAANMDLVTFVKFGNEWMVSEPNETGVILTFDDRYEYFLCLPQHNENGQCLHWLNGGEVEFIRGGEDWQDEREQYHGWASYCGMMNSDVEFRIKPRKEKRWIVAKPSALVSMMYFESESDAKDAVKYSTGEFKGGQVIEIEVEV